MLLAAMMDSPVNVAEAQALVTADDFYSEAHRRIYSAIYDLFMTGSSIEPVLVVEQLQKNGDLEVAGGRNGVFDLMATPFIAASYRSYATIVSDTSTQRQLLAVAQRLQTTVHQGEGEASSMVQLAEDMVFGLSQQRTRGDLKSSQDLVIASMERLTAASEKGSDITGLATGFTDLDRLTGGLRPGNLVVIAARPSMGKTAFALGIAEHVALREQGTVAVFSLEMSDDEVVQRMLGSVAMVDVTRLRSGRLAPEDWPRITRAADAMTKCKLYVDDSEGMTLGEMRTKARRLKSREGLDLIVVDYIQLMESRSGRRDENRVQELSTISRGLKMLGRDLGVPVIVLSQLNRTPDSRNDKRPMLSDLRESGAIEQDADMVMMIYREEYYNQDCPPDEKGIAEVNLAKHRNGPTDRVKLTFMGKYAKFGNLQRDA